VFQGSNRKGKYFWVSVSKEVKVTAVESDVLLQDSHSKVRVLDNVHFSDLTEVTSRREAT
jgi:hypothetical protein